jgi:hypothetical protein
MYVISQNGCPNGLYAEMNILSGGAVVSYTNDSLGSLPAGQTAQLTFDAFDLPSDVQGQLTKINCY